MAPLPSPSLSGDGMQRESISGAVFSGEPISGEPICGAVINGDPILWDVIAVGAGPDGAALACRLRPRYRVLLLERGRLVSQDMASACGAGLSLHRAPPIGESLPGAAQTLLRRFGLYERFLADGHAQRTATVLSLIHI